MDTTEKQAMYRLMNAQLAALVQGEHHPLPNLANAAALLWETLPDINWAGFYVMQDGGLLLGPFQGKPACIRIPLGKGVCGTAVARDALQLVANVHEFPGHIACDSASNAEIVVPLHKNGRVVGVLDIDSPCFSRFDETDAAGLQEFAAVLEQACGHMDF